MNRIIELTQIESINQILKLYHQSVLGGHVGIERMRKTIGSFYKWPSMTNDIKNFVKNCPICEKTKITRHTKMPLQITSTGTKPFEHIFIDYVGPISPDGIDGDKIYKYIFMATCDLTKYVIAIPTENCTAETTANCLVDHVILKYDFPKILTSDNASYFTSDLFKEVNKKLKIKQIFSTPYHPQSNIVERVNRVLNQYMRAFATDDKWFEMLPYASNFCD